jgi:hypothetical protein
MAGSIQWIAWRMRALVGERPVPDRLVVEDAVAQLPHFVEALDEVHACALSPRHVRKYLFDHRRPQHLLVAPIEETGPEAEVELGDDASDVGPLAFTAKLGARLLERIDLVPVVDDLDVVEPVAHLTRYYGVLDAVQQARDDHGRRQHDHVLVRG